MSDGNKMGKGNYAVRWLTVEGVRTRVLVAGAEGATPLLLLHDGGWGASADMSWERVIPFLEDDFRVIAPDLTGYGATDKIFHFGVSGVESRMAHVSGVLDAFGLEDAVFVGNSLGGTLAVRALADPAHRARMRGAITIGGSGGPWKTEMALSELTKFDGTRKDMCRWVRLLGIDPDGEADYVDRRLEWAHQPGHYGVMSAPRIEVPEAFGGSGGPREHFPAGLPRDDFPEMLRGVDTPLLLISGRDDPLLENDWTDHIAKVVTGAQTLEMPSGHCPNVTIPQQTANVVREFAGDLR